MKALRAKGMAQAPALQAGGWMNRVRRFFRREAAQAAEPVPTTQQLVSFFPPNDQTQQLAVQGHAAARWDETQSWLPSFVQDARQDVDPGSRIEIIRRTRYFEQTNAFVQKVLDLIETNVVGTGVTASPASHLKRFNERSLEWWNEWCKRPDVSSDQDFYALQAIIARAMAVDGEIFVYLTTDADPVTGRQFPRLRLIESHRVVSARTEFAREHGFTEFDGILFDAQGRPAFYLVTNDADAFSLGTPAKVAVIPAARMVHFFEPSRTSQPRGLSLFHAVLHDIHCLDDLQRYEMKAAKKLASLADIIENETGQSEDNTAVIGRTKKVVNQAGGTEDRTVYYKREFGAETKYIKRGDKYVSTTPARPTIAQTDFWKILERKGCRGIGLSYAGYSDYEGSWGGAALRAAITSDNRFYDVRTANLLRGLDRIWRFVMRFPIEAGELGRAPRDWRAIGWNRPRRATVDIGRESKLILDEWRAGMRTEQGIQGELGQDYNKVREQRELEVDQRMDAAKRLAKKHDLPVLTALALLSDLPRGVKPAERGDDEDDEDTGARSRGQGAGNDATPVGEGVGRP